MGDRLEEKVALVSGAGSSGPGWGNGKATAVLFAREGAKVLAADINLDAAFETKRIIEAEGGTCEAVAGDVSRADHVAAVVDACIAGFRRILRASQNVGIVEAGGPVENQRGELGQGQRRKPEEHIFDANSILPGMMNTPMVHAAEVIAAYGGSAEEMVRRRDEQCPMGRMGDAWDVAYAALFLASDEAKYITGTELVVDGGLTVNCV
jgi:NAD(P)-dependent dehydrogenase (short-subunit alcohol dehydrogenase family)